MDEWERFTGLLSERPEFVSCVKSNDDLKFLDSLVVYLLFSSFSNYYLVCCRRLTSWLGLGKIRVWVQT